MDNSFEIANVVQTGSLHYAFKFYHKRKPYP